VTGRIATPVGDVPQVATTLTRSDKFGAMKVRTGIGRMSYTVQPGLYAVGQPDAQSPVFVSANYKLSFDRLRQELAGVDGWIMVLDTKGINVWCAAGKGTFGTDEIVNRVESTQLGEVVAHSTLIVPQLGAPGVAAHEVKKRTGFSVVYGPVRAADIPEFLAAGMKATAEMRRMRFDLRDRLAVVPIELVHWANYVLAVMIVLFLLAGLGRDGYDWQRVITTGSRSVVLMLVAFISGAVAAPVLLPWLPGKAFWVKGAALGLIVSAGATALGWIPLGGALEATAWWLVIPTVSSFVALNYTGTTTYTSLSGVRREMRVAIPLQIASAAIGLGLWIAARFVESAAPSAGPAG
jgi:acetyl-CoA decarbonylase/synthase complex subunit gamma